MSKQNNTVLLKRDLMLRLLKIIMNQHELEEIDRIPVEMTPKNIESAIRCCIYRERAATRSGIIALLGFNNKYDDEIRQLSSYAQEALKREDVCDDFLTIIPEGCSNCLNKEYTVTDVCRGCVARPCEVNCPVKAISVKNGRANINHDACINCGICQKKCPYHAITYIPVPCEDVCPVNAITKNDQGEVEIDKSKCILCGKCKVSCPFGAIMEISEVTQVVKSLLSNQDTTAVIAPAIAGQYPFEYGKIISGLRELGFDHVVEAAWGADETAKLESEEWKEKIESDGVMTSSCCPAYVQYMKVHDSDNLKYVSHTPSPMVLAVKAAKEKWNTKTVFIGPCIGKRSEAKNDSNVDYILTFEELGAMFAAKNIQLQALEESDADLKGSPLGRAFAGCGGVADYIKDAVADEKLKLLKIDGLTAKNCKLLKTALDKKVLGNFIEVMACEGGCINGPSSLNNSPTAKAFLKKNLTK
jgi:[FeFe] hydrogenase (group B1/B3)